MPSVVLSLLQAVTAITTSVVMTGFVADIRLLQTLVKNRHTAAGTVMTNVRNV